MRSNVIYSVKHLHCRYSESAIYNMLIHKSSLKDNDLFISNGIKYVYTNSKVVRCTDKKEMSLYELIEIMEDYLIIAPESPFDSVRVFRYYDELYERDAYHVYLKLHNPIYLDIEVNINAETNLKSTHQYVVRELVTDVTQRSKGDVYYVIRNADNLSLADDFILRNSSMTASKYLHEEAAKYIYALDWFLDNTQKFEFKVDYDRIAISECNKIFQKRSRNLVKN